MIVRAPIRTPIRQRGFTLIAAIFILIVLSALGVFIVTIGDVQRAIVIAAGQNARVNYAADGGLEWGIYNATVLGNCAAGPIAVALNGLGVNGVTVNVSCTPTVYSEGGTNNVTVYLITSTATYGAFNSLDYFSRTLQISVTN